MSYLRSISFRNIAVAFMIFLCSGNLMAEKANAAELIVLNSSDLVARINSDNVDYKVVLFFTSWCSSCQGLIADLVGLRNNGSAKIYLVSLDTDPAALSNFVGNLPEAVNVYHMPQTSEVNAFFDYFGFNYRNKVPHLSLLGRQNNVISDNCTIGYVMNQVQ